MPRIKSPILIIEQNYNKRYDLDTQRLFLRMIDQRKLNTYANDFITNLKFNDSAGNLILSEAQADYLADLYEKYSS